MQLLNEEREKKLFRARLKQVLIFLAILASILIVRLYYLDVVHFKRYKTLSHNNRITLVPLPPARGLITDRHGKLLAKNVPVYDLEILPNKVGNIDSLLERLKTIINLNDNDIRLFRRALKQRRRYESVPLKFGLSEEELSRFSVNQVFFPGVLINAGLMRSYPYGETMAHIIGYVGRINTNERRRYDTANYAGTHFVGKVGIEKRYEDSLHGTVGYLHLETDATGRRVRTLKTVSSGSGVSLQLTVDLQLQQAAQQALSGLHGAAIAIQPQTGEILAMASSPSYDPNLFVKGMNYQTFKQLTESPYRPLYNRAVHGQYPLASTIKPFLSLKALDEQIVSMQTKIFDPGWFQLANNSHHYRDWKRGGHGWIDLRHAIISSCDTYFYFLSEKLGIQAIDDILFQFGFGKPTKIDMDREVAGLIPTPHWKQQYKKTAWYTGDTLISGIGQGFMLTTPLQLANATAQLANRGQRFMPYLVKKQYVDRLARTTLPRKVGTLTLKHNHSWDAVITAMEQVITDRHGTGFRFGADHSYRIAGKTGTAQVYSIKQQRQSESEEDIPAYLRDHSLFIAFAPIDKPAIAVAVVVEHNNLATNVARTILDDYLQRPHDD